MNKPPTMTIKLVQEETRAEKAPAARLKFVSTPPRAIAATKSTTFESRLRAAIWCRSG